MIASAPRFARSLGLAALVASTAALLPGCGDDPEPAVARVILVSQISRGTNGQNCQLDDDWVVIGGFGNPTTGPDGQIVNPPTPVDNGSTFGQGTVSVSCAVIPSGEMFDVNATATLSGPLGGTVTVTGKMGPSGDQPNIRAVFQRASDGRYSQSDCTVNYLVNKAAGIAAGRVWGELVCNAATNEDQQKVCETRAQFRFENCQQ